MKTNLGILLLAVASLTLGCVVHTHPRPEPVYAPPPPPPPPPPPVAQPMSYQEAAQMSVNYASSRGYQSQVQDAHLERNNVWEVKLAVYRGELRGRMHLEFDAYSRALIRADEKVKDHHGHGHHGEGRWEDEDDEDFHEHGASAVGRPPPGQVINDGQYHGASPVHH